MPAASQAQTSIYETTIDNEALEAALEEREKAKDAKRKANQDYDAFHDKVKALIAIADIADAPVRVGRFVISQKETKPTPVSFERGGGKKLQISLLGEDD